MTWKPKVKTFQIIAKGFSNNIRIHVPMKVHILFICQSGKKNSPFVLDSTQIEQYVNIACVIWKSKTHPAQHLNMHNSIKQDFID